MLSVSDRLSSTPPSWIFAAEMFVVHVASKLRQPEFQAGPERVRGRWYILALS